MKGFYKKIQPGATNPLQVKKPLQLKHNVAGWMDAIHSFQLAAFNHVFNIKLLFWQEVGIAYTHIQLVTPLRLFDITSYGLNCKVDP